MPVRRSRTAAWALTTLLAASACLAAAAPAPASTSSAPDGGRASSVAGSDPSDAPTTPPSPSGDPQPSPGSSPSAAPAPSTGPTATPSAPGQGQSGGGPTRPPQPGPSSRSTPPADPGSTGPTADGSNSGTATSPAAGPTTDPSASVGPTGAPAPVEVPQAATPADGPDRPVWGVDVSRWQHPAGLELDWSLVAGSAPGFGFAFVKGSEATLPDVNPHHGEDVAAARAAGALVGTYHYAVPSLPVAQDARTEARHAVAVAGRPAPGDLPLVLDLEANPDGLSARHLARWTLTWLRTVERMTGRRPILYTYPSFFSAEVRPDERLARYPLWIAHYGLDVAEPWVPEPWTSWTFWQHSSQGSLDGTYGPIDLNVFAGSAGELRLLAGHEHRGRGVDAAGASLLGEAVLSGLASSAGAAPDPAAGPVDDGMPAPTGPERG